MLPARGAAAAAGGGADGRRWPYLGDSHNGEDVSFAEGQVLLGGTMEVVLGDTFCTGRPNGLAGERGTVSEPGWAHLPPLAPLDPRGPPPPTGTRGCWPSDANPNGIH